MSSTFLTFFQKKCKKITAPTTSRNEVEGAAKARRTFLIRNPMLNYERNSALQNPDPNFVEQ